MELNPLNALSPIDGRYFFTASPLHPYFSEFGLIKYRVWVEVAYFVALCELPLPQLKGVSKEKLADLRKVVETFDIPAASRIKEIEKTTNHDVKAVEYFLREKFVELELTEYQEFIHFGLTSQDINNTAVPLQLKDAINEQFLPKLTLLLNEIERIALAWKNVPMLARTHGQPASPTSLGKEFMVFKERLSIQIGTLKQIPFSAKFGGATGNFNAHHVAYPNIDWEVFADDFLVDKLLLKRSSPTTQVEHYDYMAALFDNLKRINTILIDFSRDIWQYVAMNYFTQKIKEGEVGSSAMPHKVNPIDFENAEGNLGLANAIYEFLSAKLPISRLQRDLSDSTVLRNVGLPIAHSYIALSSLLKGLSKLQLNEAALNADLDNNWAVVAEAIQTILRREGYQNPYEVLKGLTRKNEKITKDKLSQFIEMLQVSEEVKSELKRITPYNYIGILPPSLR